MWPRYTPLPTVAGHMCSCHHCGFTMHGLYIGGQGLHLCLLLRAPHGMPSSCQSPCDGANPARIPSTDEAGDRTIQSSAVRYHMVPLACCRNPHPAMHCMPMKWIATIHDLIGLHLGVCCWPLTAHHLGQALRTETPDQLVSHDQQNATMCNHHALALLCGRCRHPCR